MNTSLILKIFLFLFVFSVETFAVSKMMPIKFRQYGEISYIDLVFDQENVNASKFHIKENKQIIIDLKDTTIDSESVLRGFDTSEFSGAITYVKAYARPQTPNDLRILIQLRDNVRSSMEREGNKIIVGVENRFGVFSKQKVDSIIKEEKGINDSGVGKYNVPKSASIEDILENITLSGRKKYIGKKISLNVKNLAVDEILRMIADASGFNIIVTEEIKELKPLSLTLTNIPWDQVLDTILGLNKLVADKNGIILMIRTLAAATKEKKIESEAKKLSEEQEPLVTKVFALSYSTIKDMQKIVKEYLTPKRGKLSTDERTNSIIVKDTLETMEKVKKIIEYLDTQTPQVLIESKIIEVQDNYAKNIGLKNGIQFGYDPFGSKPSDRASVGSEAITGAGQESGPGFNFISAPSSTNTSLFSFGIGTFKRLFNVGLDLELMEAETKLKVIATPKVVTQNKMTANIDSTDSRSFRVRKQDATGAETVTFEQTNASINLKVTPQVTNEGSIMMEVAVTKQEFLAGTAGEESPPDKSSRDIKTNVLVENGSTVVIGGLYKFKKQESHSGVPFLKDIPLIGWLFRSSYNPATEKSELIIFLTPRIINQEEAGLANEI